MTPAGPRADVYLTPGELAVRRGAFHVRTILGSCVAVCLCDRARGIGGMNHFLLPTVPAGDVADNRHGAVATARLIEALCAAGAERSRLEAAVIGGGNPVDSIKVGAVGPQNVAAALAVLRAAGIRVVHEDTGGAHGRRLLFNTQTGELVVHRIRGVGAPAAKAVR